LVGLSLQLAHQLDWVQALQRNSLANKDVNTNPSGDDSELLCLFSGSIYFVYGTIVLRACLSMLAAQIMPA
jgi:hypothetical protein